MERHGVVTAVHGNTADIEIIQMSACASCHIRALCVAGESAPRTVQAPADGALHPGMSVVLSMDERMGWLGVLVGFVLPLILVVATLFALRGVVPREEVAGLIALGALVPYYGAVHHFRGYFDRVVQFRARPRHGASRDEDAGHGARRFYIVRKEGSP